MMRMVVAIVVVEQMVAPLGSDECLTWQSVGALFEQNKVEQVVLCINKLTTPLESMVFGNKWVLERLIEEQLSNS